MKFGIDIFQALLIYFYSFLKFHLITIQNVISLKMLLAIKVDLKVEGLYNNTGSAAMIDAQLIVQFEIHGTFR